VSILVCASVFISVGARGEDAIEQGTPAAPGTDEPLAGTQERAPAALSRDAQSGGQAGPEARKPGQCEDQLAGKIRLLADLEITLKDAQEKRKTADNERDKARNERDDAQRKLKSIQDKYFFNPGTRKPDEEFNALQNSLNVALGNLDKEIRALEAPAKGQGE